MSRAGNPWRWKETTDPSRVELVDGRDRIRAFVFTTPNGSTWHTFDDNGVGGENSTSGTIDGAKRHAVASIVLQGWAPGGWRVTWRCSC